MTETPTLQDLADAAAEVALAFGALQASTPWDEDIEECRERLAIAEARHDAIVDAIDGPQS